MQQLANRFIIIIPVCNAEGLILSAIRSVLSQDFTDLGIIIRDDCSTDDTPRKIAETLSVDLSGGETRIDGKDILFIRNKEKLYPGGNTYDSVIKWVSNSSSVIGVVDGDDELLSTAAVSEIYNVYIRKLKWLVWSQHQLKSVDTICDGGYSSVLPPDEIIYSTRNYWAVSHFRTCKAWLFKKIDRCDLDDPFTAIPFIKMASDAALLYPIIEMCGNNRSFFLDRVHYLYNDSLPTNESTLYSGLLPKYIDHIRNHQKKYKPLSSKKRNFSV
jgi:glycosyltransferase involved in cell wall biosynthesis